MVNSSNSESPININVVSSNLSGMTAPLIPVGESMVIRPNSELQDTISSRPILIPTQTVEELQQDISLVSFNTLSELSSIQERSFSPRLINWVEPEIISGITKTAFYTEVNSGLAVGDRIFIIGGNYCNNELIEVDKYKRGRDGYKILQIDNCRIVLDIDYTGVLPWNDVDDDQFIKVYYIRNRNEFIQANRQISTRGGFSYKFGPGQNNLAFIDETYTSVSGWGKTVGAFQVPGFLYKPDSNSAWIPVPFLSGSFSLALSPTFSNNGRVKIMNGSFTHSGKEYKEGYVYKYIQGPTQSEWVVDVTYLQPFLTKTNFRGGNFKGTWNTGLYGKQNSKITWHGTGTWNSGTLLNTKWQSGTLNSIFTQNESWFTTFDEFGQPYQKTNSPNNNGRSFNYIFDSEILTCRVNRGNIYNTVFATSSISNPIVENYILSATESFTSIIERAYIESSVTNNTLIQSSEINNSKSENSKIEDSRIVNSYFIDSLVRDSSYTSDTVIKILDYDEFNISETISVSSTFSSVSGPAQKIYKFYINEEGYKRLKNGDIFYLKGIKINNGNKDIINFFDKKFKLTSWTEYIDAYSDPNSISNLPTGVTSDKFYKRGIQHSAFLSTPEENNFTLTTVTDGINYFSSTAGSNSKKNYSIDIITSLYDIRGNTFSGVNFNRDLATSSSASPTMSNSIGNIIDITSAYIIDSDFKSGLIETSDWNSGPHIEYNWDNNITTQNGIGGTYRIQVSTSSQTLSVTVSYDPTLNESEGFLYVGKTIFLRAVDYIIDGIVTGVTISSVGTSYSTAIGVGVSGSVSGSDLLLNITATQSGSITSAVISSGGRGYSVGETLNVLAGNSDATITILSVSQSVTRIPDSWRITQISGSQIQLGELYSGTNSVLAGLSQGGYFKSIGAENRWGYLHGVKFFKTKIKSGIFRRPYISGSFIENDTLNSKDIDYRNLEVSRNLVISDGLFSNNQNILSRATYIYSSFVGGSDIFNDGIVQYSIWNGGQFNIGTIKQSRWINGNFNSGLFYESRSFNATASQNSPFYYSENLKNWWKDGLTTATQSNDRWSWQNGKFGSQFYPEFYKSDWESGEFIFGKFYFSNFYGGTFSSGDIGDISVSTNETMVYNGDFLNAKVLNATLIARDTSYLGNQPQLITWKNGLFNGGVFATDYIQSTNNQSIWEDGIFNSGEFMSMAKWRSGSFNGGKFTTAFGWTNSNSASQSHYGWEDGKFNGGEFGNANGLTNSTWWTGEFNNGTFKGRVWNIGVFQGGIFEGSATTSAVGGTNSSNANLFVDGWSQSYYGLWRDGYFTETKSKFSTKKEWTTVRREIETEIARSRNRAIIRNSLWQTGTFSHQSGEMINSVWLDGNFQAGKMTRSSFNPYVRRNGNPTQSFNLSEGCKWENGIFNDGDFYISKWHGGTFELGNAWGMIWKGGTVQYMNAFNIFWENGLWRNGNWYGSSFEFPGSITNDFEKQILFRGMSWSGTASAHYWNIFEIVDPKSKFFYLAGTATPVVDTSIDPGNISQPPTNPPGGNQ